MAAGNHKTSQRNIHHQNDLTSHKPRRGGAVDTIELDYPELGLADYKTSTNHPASTKAQQGREGSTANLPFKMNGLTPLNTSQVISRRLKLDLRNETEIPIAGKTKNNMGLRILRGIGILMLET